MPTTYDGDAGNATGTQVTIDIPENGDPLTAESGTAPWNFLADWAQRLADIALNIATTAWTFTLGIVFTLRATFNDGVLVNAPSTSNRPGTVSTGNGNGAGAVNTGGATGAGSTNTGGASGGAGAVNAGTGNFPGSTNTGAGNGAGAECTSSGTGGAVQAVAVGSGPAVDATAASGTGYGVKATGNATSAAIQLTPVTADPSVLANGNLWLNSTDGKLRIRIGGVTVDLN